MFGRLKRFNVGNIDLMKIAGLESLKIEESVERNILSGVWSEEKQRWRKEESL